MDRNSQQKNIRSLHESGEYSTPHQVHTIHSQMALLNKKMWNKVSADNQDLYLCLLAYRNTVIDNLALPAHLLMGRRLRSNLPVVSSQLQPEVVRPTGDSQNKRE